jgi:hypothetical protein
MAASDSKPLEHLLTVASFACTDMSFKPRGFRYADDTFDGHFAAGDIKLAARACVKGDVCVLFAFKPVVRCAPVRLIYHNRGLKVRIHWGFRCGDTSKSGD